MGRDGLVKQWISPLLRTGKLAQRTAENTQATQEIGIIAVKAKGVRGWKSSLQYR